MTITIEEWDPHAAADDTLRARYAYSLEIEREFDPETPDEPYELWRAQLLQVNPFRDVHRWLACDGDAIVGIGFLAVNRVEENRHLADCDISVLPAYRRRGVGRDILQRIRDVAAADGRTTLGAGTVQGSVAEPFLRAQGFEQKLVDRRSRLRVADVDQGLVDRWIIDAKATAADYSLVLTDGPMPDEYIEAFIDLEHTMNDAPRDELDMEDWKNTPEQFKDEERRYLEAGTRWMILIARHEPTGAFAGFTSLEWHPLQPELVWQGGTAVRDGHRGHAIGRWLKASMLDIVRERVPEVQFIDTWNAGSNQWMLAINDDLGFTPYIWYTAWQARLADL